MTRSPLAFDDALVLVFENGPARTGPSSGPNVERPPSTLETVPFDLRQLIIGAMNQRFEIDAV
jgi:hypothetical protein